MYVVLLRFGGDRASAARLMEAHNQWIEQGFADGVFLMVGTLQPNAGGAILAHNTSRDELEGRVANDPFVANGVVTSQILEVTPSKTSQQLAFLQG